MKLPKELVTVTNTSKALAIILFIALPFVGFLYGFRFGEFTERLESRMSVDKYMLQYQKTVGKSSTPSAKTDLNMANWKTYIDEEFGFVIQYPEDWEIPPVAYNAAFTLIMLAEKDASDYAWIRINRSNPDVREISYCESRALEEKNRRCETVNINGQLGVVDWQLNDTTAQIYLNNQTSRKEVSILYSEPNGINQSARLLFKQILSTFRFLE